MPNPKGALPMTPVTQYMPQASYQTQLPVPQEWAFQQWVKQNSVPFGNDTPTSDYDMRGFYQGLQQGDPRATSAVNPTDHQLHFPDTWKTPYHASFSNESQWATPLANQWTPQAPYRFDSRQMSPDRQRITFDEMK